MASAQELVVESTEDLLDTSSGFRDALSLLYANKGGLFGAIVTAIVLIIGCIGAGRGSIMVARAAFNSLYLSIAGIANCPLKQRTLAGMCQRAAARLLK